MESAKTKRLKCTFCGKLFRRPARLKRHEREQHERPYACDQCGKKFKRQSTLSIHKRTHSNVKQYPCTHCHSVAFHQKSNLEAHVRNNCKANYAGVSAASLHKKSNVKVAVLDQKRAEQILRSKTLTTNVSTSPSHHLSNSVSFNAPETPLSSNFISCNEFESSILMDDALESPFQFENFGVSDFTPQTPYQVENTQGTHVNTETLLFKKKKRYQYGNSPKTSESYPKVDHNTETIIKYLKESPDSTKHSRKENPEESLEINFENEPTSVNHACSFLPNSLNRTMDESYIVSNFVDPVKTTDYGDIKNDICTQMDITHFSSSVMDCKQNSKTSGIIVQETVLPSSTPNLELKPGKKCDIFDTKQRKLVELKNKEERMREHLIYLINLMAERKAQHFARTKVRNLLAVTDAEKRLKKCLQDQIQNGMVPDLTKSPGIENQSVVHNIPTADELTKNLSKSIHLMNGTCINDTSRSIARDSVIKGANICQSPPSKKEFLSSQETILDAKSVNNLPPSIVKPVLLPEASGSQSSNNILLSTQMGNKTQGKNFTKQPHGIDKTNTQTITVIPNSPPPFTRLKPVQQLISSNVNVIYANEPVLYANEPIQPAKDGMRTKRTLREIRPKPSPVIFIPNNQGANVGVAAGHNGVTVTFVSQASSGLTIAPVSNVCSGNDNARNEGNSHSNKKKIRWRANLPILPKSPVVSMASSLQGNNLGPVSIGVKPLTAQITTRVHVKTSKDDVSDENNFKPKSHPPSDTTEGALCQGVTVTPMVLNSTFSIPEKSKSETIKVETSPTHVTVLDENKSVMDFVDPQHIAYSSYMENEPNECKTDSENKMDIVLSSVNSVKFKPSGETVQQDISSLQFAPPEENSVSFEFLSSSDSRDRLCEQVPRITTPIEKYYSESDKFHSGEGSVSEIAMDDNDKFQNESQTNEDHTQNKEILQSSFEHLLSENASSKTKSMSLSRRFKSPDKISDRKTTGSDRNFLISPSKFFFEIQANDGNVCDSTILEQNRRESDVSDKSVETSHSSHNSDTSPEVKRYQSSPVKGFEVENSNLSTASQGELLEILHSLLKDIPKQISPGKSEATVSAGRMVFSPIKGLGHDLTDVSSAINLAQVFASGSQLESSPPKLGLNLETSPNRMETPRKRTKVEINDCMQSLYNDQICEKSEDQGCKRTNIISGDQVDKTTSIFKKFGKSQNVKSSRDDRETCDKLVVSNDIATSANCDDVILKNSPPRDDALCGIKTENSNIDDVVRPLVVNAPELFDENTMDKIIRVVEDLRALSNSNQ